MTEEIIKKFKTKKEIDMAFKQLSDIENTIDTSNMKVIIDGIEITACKFYSKCGFCKSPINQKTKQCTKIPIEWCYYKQLKRLEQENNSLQAQLNNITVQSNNTITALEQENKRMSAILKGCGLGDNDDCSFCGVDKAYKELKQENKELKAYKDVNEDFKKAWDELNKKYKQLRSALKEIRKMVDCERRKYINCNVSQCAKIETKINEVLNDGRE